MSDRSRPTWDETWLSVARAVAARSLCVRDQVGAVIVDATNRIVDTGHNGPPAGFAHNNTPCLNWCKRAKPSFTYETTQRLSDADKDALGALDIQMIGDKFFVDGVEVLDPHHFFTSRGFERKESISPCYDDCPSLHAEANALMFSDRRLRQDGTIYVTSHVCSGCAKLIANSGLARVVVYPGAPRAYRNSSEWYDFMRSCGLEVDIVTG